MGRTKVTVPTMTEIKLHLHKYMKSHMGSANGISKIDLFESVYGPTRKYNIFQQHYYWTMLKRAMHVLRKKTNCFIISQKVNDTYHYFVLGSAKDAKIYKDNLDSNIRGMKKMKERVDKLVAQKSWEEYKLVA